MLQAPKLCLLIQTILHLHFSSPKSMKNTPDALLFSGKILFPKSILKILPPIPILNCFRFPTSAKILATRSFLGACSWSFRLLAPQTASRVILELTGSSPSGPSPCSLPRQSLKWSHRPRRRRTPFCSEKNYSDNDLGTVFGIPDLPSNPKLPGFQELVGGLSGF